jgi:Fur family ferric uptake transcriptional regulator
MIRLFDPIRENAIPLADLHRLCFEDPWDAQAIARLAGGSGFALVHGSPPDAFILARVAAGEAEILTIATRPDMRRSGIARALMHEVARTAAQRGAHVLFLEVDAQNAAAIALYDSLGFARVGERKAYYRAANGQRRDALVLKRDLPLGLAADYTGPREQEASLTRIEKLCVEKGLRMTDQRRVIARVLSDAIDHPDAEELYRRASAVDPHISIATVYRTVKLFEDAGILERHDFRDGRSRYEEVPESHHDHLIDVQSGKVIEFRNEEIERLQRLIADELGFELIDHRLELYGVPRGGKKGH